jgi:hypothetical protein
MTSFSLVCPFLTDDPMFAYGVEFGMLFTQMRGDQDRIAGYFCRKNQDRILLLASRLGWSVDQIKPWDNDWFWCALEKNASMI